MGFLKTFKFKIIDILFYRGCVKAWERKAS